MNNINAGIVDQRLNGIINDYPDLFTEYSDEARKKSAAFVALVISCSLDIPVADVGEMLTDGGNDAGVDGIYMGDIEDGEFQITVFQGKYKNDLSGSANFPEGGVKDIISAVRSLFDPHRDITLNPKIKPRIEEIRSLIRDGYIPSVRAVLCNNGKIWTEAAENHIKEAQHDFGDKVEFIHFNHDDIVGIMHKGQKIDAKLKLSGPSIVEDMDYTRVMVGRISVHEIFTLFENHGDKLLQRNIRRYLGLRSNRVNSAIHDSLISPDTSKNFYFYNNGVTVICDKFDYNAFEKTDHTVTLKNMQIINGGQTCKTIHETLKKDANAGNSAYLMLRIYQLSDENANFVRDVTYATNSQNPVDLRDLHSNDAAQRQLETGIEQLGYTYRRYREEGLSGSSMITSSTVAEAVLSTWRNKPHVAKFRRSEHFGKLYDTIFDNLNAAQAVLAVIIFRFAENERKRPTSKVPPQFLPYASQYIAMLMCKSLLADMNLTVEQVNHRNFEDLKITFEKNANQYHTHATQTIEGALKKLYGNRPITLQQMSATFRRSDLMDYID